MFAHDQRLFRKKGQGGLTLVLFDQFYLSLSLPVSESPPVLLSFLLFPFFSCKHFQAPFIQAALTVQRVLFGDAHNLTLRLALLSAACGVWECLLASRSLSLLIFKVGGLGDSL